MTAFRTKSKYTNTINYEETQPLAEDPIQVYYDTFTRDLNRVYTDSQSVIRNNKALKPGAISNLLGMVIHVDPEPISSGICKIAKYAIDMKTDKDAVSNARQFLTMASDEVKFASTVKTIADAIVLRHAGYVDTIYSHENSLDSHSSAGHKVLKKLQHFIQGNSHAPHFAEALAKMHVNIIVRHAEKGDLRERGTLCDKVLSFIDDSCEYYYDTTNKTESDFLCSEKSTEVVGQHHDHTDAYFVG